MSGLNSALRYFIYAIVFMLTQQVTHAQEPSSDNDLSMRDMIRIVQSTPDELSKQWDAHRLALEAKLSSQGDEEKRQEIRW
nr:hypothetical protein [uncultured Undibacterium sp.]